MEPVRALDVLEAYRHLHRELVALLAELEPGDWRRPVPDSRWSVQEVAAHLLDGDLRRLSFQRDGAAPPSPETPIRSPEDLVAFLDRLNEEWLRATRRLSPGVLRELLAWAGGEVVRLFESLDPDGRALFAVAWAGEEVSSNRFDIAREYTEKWVHQQQIRDATGRPGAGGPKLLRPVLDTFLRALPFAYRQVAAEPATAVALLIEGEAGGAWSLVREGAGWSLYEGMAERPAATLRMTADTAWRSLATRRHKQAYLDRVTVEGDRSLAAGFAAATAVMA